MDKGASVIEMQNQMVHQRRIRELKRTICLLPTTPPPLANDASAFGRRRLHRRSPVDDTYEVSYSGLQLLPPPPSFTLFTGLRLYIRNLPLHMDEVLVQTTKSRRIRMVERKTRKRSVGKPKTKHLEARHTMDRPEKKKRSVTLIRDHSKEYLSNLTVEFVSVGMVIHVFRSIHGVELAD
ncbi:unnamed protein product [Lactuca virosa]|uniref:Uncharacterized protein n=1 Tax=Lactuca virosa TaxID=75947 RepID=A0AAU9MFC8_9ASTR|nr:unnamed protein product [Lactuca virosa]